MTRIQQVVFLILVAILPVTLLVEQFSPKSGFLSVPHFGKAYIGQALPEVRQLDPPTRFDQGYDGQFYAQIALSPSLTHPDLPTACDNFRYRARRMGLPFTAYLIGLGNPAFILQAYSVLNIFFWLLLLGALARFVGFREFRQRLLAVAVLLATGTLTSIQLALTDLPALTISVWGILLAETHVATAGGLLALSALFKETSVLSFPTLAWIDQRHPLQRLTWMITLLVSPLILWSMYVQSQTPLQPLGLGNFSLPFLGIYDKVLYQLSHRPRTWVEFSAPIAIIVQGSYLFFFPRPASAWWRSGIGWVVLAVCAGMPIWIEHQAFSRVLLPLTIAFNFLIYHHERSHRFAWWYLLGNAGILNIALLPWIAFEIAIQYWKKQRPGQDLVAVTNQSNKSIG